MRIVVVCADPSERLRAVSALASRHDVDLIELASASEVHDLLLVRRESVDVLVIDGDLAPRGGFATLYDLRSAAELAMIEAAPALVMTARSQDAWLAKWAGADAVIVKPVDPFVLADRAIALVGTTAASHGDRDADAEQLAAALRDRR